MKKLGILIVGLVMLLTAVPVLAAKPTDKPGAVKVPWNLSGAVMPVPPYGSLDIPGSDTASKLIFNQPNGKVAAMLTGEMNGLNPDTTYTVYLSNGYTKYVLASVAGSYIFDFQWNGGSYPNDVVLTQTGNVVSGTIGWPSGPAPYTVTGIVTGTVTGNQVNLTVAYSDRLYLRTMTGTIIDGGISGNWNDANPANDNGIWSTTGGSAIKASVGNTGWSDQFNGTLPFTFTTDSLGSGSWHYNFKGTVLGSISVWINNGGTLLISDSITL